MTTRPALAMALIATIIGCQRSADRAAPEGARTIPGITRHLDSLLQVDRDSIQAQYTRLLKSSPQLARALTVEHAAFVLFRRCETICRPLVPAALNDWLRADSLVCVNSIAARVQGCMRHAEDPGAHDACMREALSGPLC